MSEHASDAVISLLRSARDQCLSATKDYPELYYAVLEGWAIHDNAPAREYLKKIIANGSPFQADQGKVQSPCGFYFGKHLDGAAVFERIATFLLQSLDFTDGNPKYGLPAIPGDVLDCGAGAAALWLFWWIGDKHNQPLIQADNGRPKIGTRIIPFPTATTKPLTDSIFNRPHAFISLPGNREFTGAYVPFDPSDPKMEMPPSQGSTTMTPERAEWFDQVYSAQYPDSFGYLYSAIHFGDVDNVTIGRKGVFMCAHVAIGVLISQLSSNVADVDTGRRPEISNGLPSVIGAMTNAQAAVYLDKSRGQVTRWVKDGTLKSNGLPGRKCRIDHNSVKRLKARLDKEWADG